MIRFIFLILAMGASSRSIAMDLTLLGGLNYAAPTDIRSGVDQHWTGNAGGIYGLCVNLPLANLPLSFEAGLLLRSSRSEHALGSSATTASSDWIDLPFLVHYHFDPSVSLGAGGYWSFLRAGDAAIASETPDTGLILDLRGRIHMTSFLSLVIDARYLHGLNNLSPTSGDTLNTRSIAALVGVSFDPLSL